MRLLRFPHLLALRKLHPGAELLQVSALRHRRPQALAEAQEAPGGLLLLPPGQLQAHEARAGAQLVGDRGET